MALDNLKDKLPALKQLLTILQFTKGKDTAYLNNLSSSEISQFLNAKYQGYKVQLESTKSFKENVSDLINTIESVLHEREVDPTLEPTFPNDPRFNTTRFNIESTRDPNRDTTSPFRLSFKPPRSFDGIFLLSPDGLYYDSQKGGLDPVALYLSGIDLPDPGDVYKFAHEPYIGGRGSTLSLDDLNAFNNTLFDINIIDNSPPMQEEYDADHFLQTLYGNRNKKVFDLSGVIRAHEDAIVNSGHAIVENYKQQLASEVGRFEELINKRKKQIEVAVKAPALYGGEVIIDPTIGGEDAQVDLFAAGGFYGGPGDTVGAVDPPAGEPGGDSTLAGFQAAGNVDAEGRVSGRQSAPTRFVELFKRGQIPVNDFSYLAALNFSIQPDYQKSLLFNNADIEGIIKPVLAKYTQPFGDGQQYGFDSLLVPTIGKGGIFYNTSSTETELVSLTDNIEVDNLVAIYNYLEGRVSDPGAQKPYDLSNVLNCAAELEGEHAAHMIGVNSSSVFADGLGIPYLAGMTRNHGYGQTNNQTQGLVNLSPSSVSAVGSVVVLPDTPAVRDLGYGTSGFSFESWIRVPNLDASSTGWNFHDDFTGSPATIGASSLTRALLACENTGFSRRGNILTAPDGDTAGAGDFGVQGSGTNLDRLQYDRSTGVVRGMVAGFTCDRRITQNLANDHDTKTQNPGVATKLAFFIAPTISRDSSSCSWINKTAQVTTSTGETEADPTYEFFNIHVDSNETGAKGQTFLDCQDYFMHVAFTVNPRNSTVNIYLDGDLMKTQSITDTFGTPANRPINIPSPVTDNSFRYSSSSIPAPSEFHHGPKYNSFTPWVIGGGFTDGMVLNTFGSSERNRFLGGGGFMGGHAGGLQSGLRGYVGSSKFYNNALTGSQVLKNYNAQKALFKNIDLRETRRNLTH